MPVSDPRREQAQSWAQEVLGRPCSIASLAGDASFRRYFRLDCSGEQYVLMDAPPEKEDVQPFLHVLGWMAQAGLRTPALIAKDTRQGFLLLEDFGDVTWAVHVQQDGDVAPLMKDALRQLHLLQAASPEALPLFDVPRMQRECDLYLDWYLPQVAGHTASQVERIDFHAALLPTLTELDALPRVPVHLDYHSRNLMIPQRDGRGGLPLGVIDFQDAVSGPVTYDLASLLYDCYQDYPETLRRELSEQFFTSLPAMLSAPFADVDAWHRQLRLTAMQRHIKAIGIFARLAFRDGKRQFLDEIPLTRRHLREEMQALGMQGEAWSLLLREPVI
jgi:N-acetylmuramate 1-kinase